MGKRLVSLYSTVMMSVFFCVAPMRLSSAEQPTEQIKSAIEQVSQVLQEVVAAQGANKDEAVEKIRGILVPRFDFTEMAKRSLGNRWKDIEGREDEFIAAFAAFVEGSYMNTLESYRGEKILYLREEVKQNLAQVDTEIVHGSENLAVDYRLHLIEGQWKVYDVVIDNISLTSNFRSQFSRILAGASIDDLLNKLRAKAAGRPV
ncbi:MAG TPA: ABC transporter substrate-binding protein [Candidatus Binatia bacterium]|jgi:phospholipid transport system substrate-binding protein